jgi:hypothetical protein
VLSTAHEIGIEVNPWVVDFQARQQPAIVSRNRATALLRCNV